MKQDAELVPHRSASRHRKSLAFALLLGLACHPAQAEPLWGANGHPLTAYPGISVAQQLDLLVDLGLRAYRVDVTSFDQIAGLHALVAGAKSRNLTILPVLIPPVDMKQQTEESLYSQARQFAKIMVDEFKPDISVWELGNELENYAIIQPCEMRDDGTQYPCAWGPAGGVSPLEYFGPRTRKVLAVLRGLSDGVKLAMPTARRAIGSAGWGHLGIFDRMQESGVDWDISVWHMYGQDPEWAFKHLATLGKPIWVTEFNYPYGSGKDGEAGQAAGLTQTMANLRRLAPTYKVEAGFVYELCDETYWAPSAEASMGLISLQKDAGGQWTLGKPKQAYAAVKSDIASNK